MSFYLKFGREVFHIWKFKCTRFGVISMPFRYSNNAPKISPQIWKFTEQGTKKNQPTSNCCILLLETLNLVPLVVFETLYGTLIVLRISKISSFSVNFAEFLNIAENQDWFCLALLNQKIWAKKWMLSIWNLGKVSSREF